MQANPPCILRIPTRYEYDSTALCKPLYRAQYYYCCCRWWINLWGALSNLIAREAPLFLLAPPAEEVVCNIPFVFGWRSVIIWITKEGGTRKRRWNIHVHAIYVGGTPYRGVCLRLAATINEAIPERRGAVWYHSSTLHQGAKKKREVCSAHLRCAETYIVIMVCTLYINMDTW